MFEEIFRYRELIPAKLPECGFAERGGVFRKDADIMDGTFRLHVTVTAAGAVDTELIENATGEPYLLYKTDAVGSFVGRVRTAISEALADVAARAFVPAAFKTRQIRMARDFVRATYGRELEFLWEGTPDNAIWRRADNRKWFGAVLSVSGRKLGFPDDGIVEIIDLRMEPECKESVLARPHCLPGWHMNKNSWYTVVMDAGVSDADLQQYLKDSYDLAADRRSGRSGRRP